MTYSIVALDRETGALGVATATAGPCVGSLVPHVLAGVGAVATQAMTNPYLALDSLDHLSSMDARSALARALADDDGRDLRQIILVDRHGGSAGWTGRACQAYAGHHTGSGFAVAGNILTGPRVLQAMTAAYGREGSFAERLMNSLVDGAAAGGDSRGLGSAALKIFTSQRYPSTDLRIDLSDNAIEDLVGLFVETSKGSYAEFMRDVVRRAPPDPR